MEIRDFVDNTFGNLHVFVDEDNTLWFSGNEIASGLGYDAPRNAILKFVEEEDRKTLKIKACTDSVQAVLWVNQNDFSNKTLINEYGMYALVMMSYAPNAREFQHWVTHEVLPSIRANGGYISGQEGLDPEERERLDSQVKSLADQVQYLKKRRHDLISENNKRKEKNRQLRRENRSVRDCAGYALDMYTDLLDEHNAYARMAESLLGGIIPQDGFSRFGRSQ